MMWAANVSAGAAAWALIVARGWLVLTLSDSSAWVGITTFAAMIPLLVVTPFAGLLADRVDRHHLLAWTFVLNIVHNLALAALTITGVVQVWHLVALSLVNGAARATQMPASQALIPSLVPREKLLNAYALNAATLHGSRLIGPALIAPLMASVGAGGAFALCTGLYILGLAQVLRIRTASSGAREPEKGVAENLLAGLSYAYSHRLVLLIIGLVAFHCSMTMSFESMLPIFSREELSAGGAGVTYLMMSVGAGAMVSALALAGVQDERMRGRLLLITGVVSGLAPIALAASSNLASANISAAIMGASQGGFMTITTAMVQSVVPDAVQGRVASLYLLFAGGVMAFANLGYGSLADVFSAPPILAIAGIGFVGIMAISLLGPAMRQLYTGGIEAKAQVT